MRGVRTDLQSTKPGTVSNASEGSQGFISQQGASANRRLAAGFTSTRRPGGGWRKALAEDAAGMSTVITLGAVVLILAFLGMFLLSRWRLRTIGLALLGIAIIWEWCFGSPTLWTQPSKSAQDSPAVSTPPPTERVG